MHLEPHAALGWAIGNIAGADRRLRNYCTLGAVLPDIDAAPYLLGPTYYSNYHHTFGHNVFLWAVFVGWVTWRCRSPRAFWLSLICFGSHLLTDAWLSGWVLYLFWPVSHARYILPGAVPLGAPINTFLFYFSFPFVAALAAIYQRSPIDIFSPKFDQLLLSFFRRRPLSCNTCGAKGNQTCAACQAPVCWRHATVKRGWRILCPTCQLPPTDKGVNI